MNNDFNPQSADAMFARILERLEQQDATSLGYRAEVQEKLDMMLNETRAVGSRVQSLENDRWYQRGIVAALGVAAVMLWEWVKSKWAK